MDQLAAMRSFVEVVDRGGFAPAGRALGLSGPMVGNHIRFLEQKLGGQLLNRTTRAQQLTELGRGYLQRCRTVLAEIDAADSDAAELIGTARGVLRVTAPHTVGSLILPQVIARFVAKHPAVTVDLHLDDHRLDLFAGGFDIALRGGKLDDMSLITRTLAPLALIVCAAPAYLARRGVPTTPGDLSAHDCLDFAASATPGVWCFETAEGLAVPIAGPFRANSGIALREAAIAGMGLILQPELLVEDALRVGQLTRVLAHQTPQSRPFQILTHPERQPTPKIRTFIDAVVRAFAPGGRTSG